MQVYSEADSIMGSLSYFQVEYMLTYSDNI